MSKQNGGPTAPLSLPLKEEIANCITHGLGLLLGIASVPVLLVIAMQNENPAGLIGSAIFGFSMLFVFAASTLYHAFQQPALKKVFRIVDHIAIYFLIAGSYTPYVLLHLNNSRGYIMLAILWSLAFGGIFFKAIFIGRFEKLSLIIYLAMGWMMVFAGNDFFSSISWEVLGMVAAGGLAYTGGVVFYRWKKLAYNHAIWHVCVLAGAGFHYVGILLSLTAS